MTETWLPLLVRSTDYAELAAIVVAREEERGSGDGSTQGSVPSMVSVGGRAGVAERAGARELELLVPWEVEQLAALVADLSLTAQRWVRALDVCSRHVGEFLSTEQVAAEAGMEVRHWRDAPRKLPGRLRTTHPGAPGEPLKSLNGRDLGHSDGQIYWAISAEQAARWSQARSLAP